MSVWSEQNNRTVEELKFEKILKKLGYRYFVNQVYCFPCREYWTWDSYAYPSQCVTGHKFDPNWRYKWCKPDFVLLKNGKLGVIYIDGDQHKRHYVQQRQRAQVQQFRDNNVKVFIIINDEINKWPEQKLLDTAKYFWNLLDNDLYYAEYEQSGDFVERSCQKILTI